MEIKNFDKEFVERTKKIIEHPSSITNEYNITLLINCMLGLVSLPIEKTGNYSKNEKFKTAIITKIHDMNVTQKSNDEYQVFKAIKNALSHAHIEIRNKNGKIAEILFWDKYPKKNRIPYYL